jgi:tetratricopeptide (TPR) repeat protein
MSADEVLNVVRKQAEADRAGESAVDKMRAAQAAGAAGDWPRAHALWQGALEMSRDVPGIWLRVGLAQREAKQNEAAMATLAEAHGLFPDHADIAVTLAWTAHYQARWDVAKPLWREVLRHFPERVDGYVAMATLLKAPGDREELRALVAEGLARFPGRREIRLDHAELLELDRDLPGALAVFQAVEAEAPSDRRARMSAVRLLRMTERLDEAAAALDEIEPAFPAWHEATDARAELAAARKDWEEALRQWRVVQARNPRLISAAIGIIQALRGLGRRAELAVFLDETVALHPGHTGLALEQAWAAVERRDWALGCELYAALYAKNPTHARVITDYGLVLTYVGRLEEAEGVLAKGVALYPEQLGMRINLARLAGARMEYARALTQWEELARLAPDNAAIRDGLTTARYVLASDTAAEVAEGGLVAGSVSVLPVQSQTDAEIAMCFESLGENCEFGLLQRGLGLEPLGLMRFAGIAPKSLAEALRAEFAGVGDPEFTNITDSQTEYVTRDTRYGMASHTYIPPSSISAEKLLPKLQQKLRFLRRKLIEDLRAREKIFVFKLLDNWRQSDIDEVVAALAAYGQPPLLVVSKATPETPPAGTVEVWENNVMRGYIDRHGAEAGGGWNIPTATWLILLRKALAIWQARQVG